MGNKSNSSKNQIDDDEEEAFYLENWEIVTPNNMLKKSKNIKFDNHIIIPKIKSNPFDDYTELKELGTGAYSKVVLVKNKITNAVRAMKIIPKEYKKGKTNEEEVINEVYLLMKMDHPNIVKIFEFYNGRNDYYLIMEYCGGGELFDKIVESTLSEIQCAYIMYQILSAINYCHKMKIIHRDIKPENILIKKDEDGFFRVKICDFGTSKAFKIGDIQNKVIGSEYYIAPEVLQKKYNSKCDLWSCGVIMYILLTKEPPFNGDNEMIIFRRVLIGKYNTELLDNYSPYAKDLISKLLEKDIKKRVDAETALNHPWFDVFKCKEILNDIQDKDMIKRFIENLKKYRSSSIIQETALAYLVHNYPENEEIENACKLFGKIDTKENGKISVEDLSQGLCKILKNKDMEEEAKKIFENLDVDGNNYLEYEEFVRAAIDKRIFLSDDALTLTFKFFDKENKETITLDSIAIMFEDCIKKDKKINIKKELKKILKDFFKVNDEFNIDYSSFCEMMQTILK